jgi:hypothetical protein
MLMYVLQYEEPGCKPILFGVFANKVLVRRVINTAMVTRYNYQYDYFTVKHTLLNKVLGPEESETEVEANYVPDLPEPNIVIGL